MLTFPGNIFFSERISELKWNSSKANHLKGRILAHSLFYPALSESSLLLPLTLGELNPWCWPFTPDPLNFCLSSFGSQAPQAWHTQSHYSGISFQLAQELLYLKTQITHLTLQKASLASIFKCGVKTNIWMLSESLHLHWGSVCEGEASPWKDLESGSRGREGSYS